MAITKLTRNYQITIPAKIRKLLKLKQGSFINVHMANGQVILTPQKLVDDDSQEWFWTKEWQQGEKEVDAAYEKGDFHIADSVEEMRKHIEESTD